MNGNKIVCSKKYNYKITIGRIVMGCDGRLNMVHCKICNEIDRREKLVLKFNSLQKHVRRQKVKLHTLSMMWGNTSCP